MLRLFRWLIWGDAHPHRYETVREGIITFGPSGSHGRGHYYDLRCTVCGNMKKFTPQ